jgi:hypothetical protein
MIEVRIRNKIVEDFFALKFCFPLVHPLYVRLNRITKIYVFVLYILSFSFLPMI